MLKQIVFAGLLVTGSAIFAQNTIAEFDFTKGSINSTNGKFQMNYRGTTKLAGEKGKQYLNIGMTKKGEGVISKQKYPELTPKGAFKVEVKARLREQTSKDPTMVLWDNNYIIDASWGPHKNNPNSKKGFIMFITREKDGSFRPHACFGFAKALDKVYGSTFKMEEDKDFTVAVEYDGVKNYTFYVDGKVNRKGQLPTGGAVVEAVFPLIIGDRVGGDYSRFDGEIVSAKLIALPAKK